MREPRAGRVVHAYLRDPAGHELSLYWAAAKRFKKTRM